MKRPAPLVLLLAGAAVAGFLAIGLASVADSGPTLGEPVVVSGSPGQETPRADPTPTPRKTKTKAEPVKPPSPHPGGDDDGAGGNDDRAGGDDDGEDDDD
ncbi:hypothetical protein HII36_27005 [Nonomuraea sp. NN258]|uniref:hypothetical protein n=1 Tax=Nonomuraea antri TaxID=2730852 RepID=UPI001568F66E|nr:hypothetical protein [Nonomuraea antri]NRQ35451.1 hypothetical protein [Nonomuraea antri]